MDATRKGGPWQHDDFDVIDGERGTAGDVGRVFQQADGAWFWGVSFQLTGRKRSGHAASLDEAKAAFRVEYERWQREAGKQVQATRVRITRTRNGRRRRGNHDRRKTGG